MSGLFGPQEKCRVMGKEMFPTKQSARAALASYGRRKGSKRIHRCVFCDTYHMTKGARGNRLGGG